MKQENITLGNKTEIDSCKLFNKHGFWALNIPKAKNGSQPCDIVAAKGENSTIMAFFVDAKHVRKNESSFTFERIESNQLSSMSFLHNFAHIPYDFIGFAIYFERCDEIFWMSYRDFLTLNALGRKSVKFSELETLDYYVSKFHNA